MACELDLKVTAEGIEDQDTFDWLNDIGCHLGQGYYISPPHEEQKFLNWMEEYNSKLGNTGS